MLVRVDKSFKLEVHIDTDEGNACNLAAGHALRIDLNNQINRSIITQPTEEKYERSNRHD